MLDIQVKEAITGFPVKPESLLHEEIAFWRDYINYRLARDSESVPPRAYDALELAELKLSLVQATKDDEDEIGQLAH